MDERRIVRDQNGDHEQESREDQAADYADYSEEDFEEWSEEEFEEETEAGTELYPEDEEYGYDYQEEPDDSGADTGDFDFPEIEDDFSDEFEDAEDSRSSFEKEYTVRTTGFFEQYGAEIREAVRDVDDEEIFSEFDDEEIEEGEYQFPKKKRKKKHWLVKIMIVLLVVAGVAAFMMSPYFDIKTIKVEGEKNFKAEEIIKMSGVRSGMNIFRVSKSAVSKALKKDAYFSYASIRRRLPDKLIITVRERNEAAYIMYGSERIVIDDEGYVLRKTKKKVKLTQLDNLKIKKMEIGEKLESSDEVYFDKALDMLKAMNKANIFFKKIIIKKVIFKAYIKDDFLCKGRTDTIIKNLENGNLSSVIKDLYNRGKRKGTIIISDDNLASYTPKVQ